MQPQNYIRDSYRWKLLIIFWWNGTLLLTLLCLSTHRLPVPVTRLYLMKWNSKTAVFFFIVIGITVAGLASNRKNGWHVLILVYYIWNTKIRESIFDRFFFLAYCLPLLISASKTTAMRIVRNCYQNAFHPIIRYNCAVTLQATW